MNKSNLLALPLLDFSFPAPFHYLVFHNVYTNLVYLHKPWATSHFWELDVSSSSLSPRVFHFWHGLNASSKKFASRYGRILHVSPPNNLVITTRSYRDGDNNVVIYFSRIEDFPFRNFHSITLDTKFIDYIKSDISHDHSIIAIVVPDSLICYDLKTFNPIYSFPSMVSEMRTTAFSHDSSLLALVYMLDRNYTIIILDTSDWSTVASFDIPHPPLHDLYQSYFPDIEFSMDNSLIFVDPYVFDIKTQSLIVQSNIPHLVYEVHQFREKEADEELDPPDLSTYGLFSYDSKYIIIDNNTYYELWDINTQSLIISDRPYYQFLPFFALPDSTSFLVSHSDFDDHDKDIVNKCAAPAIFSFDSKSLSISPTSLRYNPPPMPYVDQFKLFITPDYSIIYFFHSTDYTNASKSSRINNTPLLCSPSYEYSLSNGTLSQSDSNDIKIDDLTNDLINIIDNQIYVSVDCSLPIPQPVVDFLHNTTWLPDSDVSFVDTRALSDDDKNNIIQSILSRFPS